MNIALAQTNPTVGDVEGNTATILRALDWAEENGADLAEFPEQALIRYPPKDLLLRDEVVKRNLTALHRIAERCTRLAALVGFAEPNDHPHGCPLFNSAALLAEGRVLGCWRKRLLPS